MTTDRDSLDLNFGRWLWWGLLATIALIVVVVFLTNLARDNEPTPPSAEQVEWSIHTSEYTPTPGTVTLKGDLPLGTPTETWKDGFLLARTVGGAFGWTLDVSPEVPTPVYEIDQDRNSCDALNVHLND